MAGLHPEWASTQLGDMTMRERLESRDYSNTFAAEASDTLRYILSQLGIAAEFHPHPDTAKPLDLADTLDLLETFASRLNRKSRGRTTPVIEMALVRAAHVLNLNGRATEFLGY
jgi:hypothetical protein